MQKLPLSLPHPHTHGIVGDDVRKEFGEDGDFRLSVAFEDDGADALVDDLVHFGRVIPTVVPRSHTPITCRRWRKGGRRRKERGEKGMEERGKKRRRKAEERRKGRKELHTLISAERGVGITKKMVKKQPAYERGKLLVSPYTNSHLYPHQTITVNSLGSSVR